jgi:hypothetical protein
LLPAMSEINLHRELLEQGFTKFELGRLVRGGTLTRLRRGAYAEPLPPDAPPAVAHKAVLAATLRQLSEEAVVSHVSAAVVHGLPTWTDQLDRVHLTRDRAGGGRRRGDLYVHGLPVCEAEVTTVEGIRLTGLARTALDLSCCESLERSVAVGDAALRLGLRPYELLAVVEGAKGRHGIARARCSAGLVDVRSESPGESFSRVRFWRWRVPTPTLQHEVRDPLGRVVACGDFGWPELGTIGEFDGKVKYGRLLRPGQTPEDAVFAEKLREDRIRDLGWQVVRWTWADLANRAELVGRLEAAFRRGRDLSA